MRGPAVSTLAAVVAVGFSCAAHGQFTDPRTYENAPVGLNQLELDYGYAHSDGSIDSALVVAGAHLDLNEGAAAYTHTFSLVRHLTWIKATVPFASVSGSVSGTAISSSVAGAGDASLEIAGLLQGGPALSVADFGNYEPTTTLGLSLTVTGPSGEYDPNRVLNLGSDRWSFKPQLAVAHPFGSEKSWEVDGYLNAYFFTDNTSYHGHEILRQEPLLGIEGHLSYSFSADLWASLDANYSFRGETVVDGVNQQDSQKSLVLGTEISWSPNARNSLILVFAKSVVHENAPESTGIGIKYLYTWGHGYR